MNDTAEASEIKFLLEFFSRSQEVQWRQVPAEFDNVWVRVDEFETTPKSPVDLLAVLLVGLLNGSPTWFEEDLTDLLDEIRDLLHYWVLESPFDYVLTKPDSDDEGNLEVRDHDVIWRVLGRLCRKALAFESLAQCSSRKVSFEYLLEKYTHPIDIRD